MDKRFIEKPDYMLYEDEFDKMILRPATWEVIIREKDTGDIIKADEFMSREEARLFFMDEIEGAEIRDSEDEEEAPIGDPGEI